MKNFCYLLFLGAIISAVIPSAQASVNCHCFKERVYNPSDKFATDEYLLVTTFNSFLSKNFNVPKRDIVMMKMKGGAKPEDVIIGLYVALHAEADIDSLMEQKKNGRSWKELTSKLVPKDPEEEHPLLPLQEDDSERKIASDITNQLLQASFKLSQEEIAHLRNKQLSHREITFFLLLASHVGTTGEELIEQQRENRLSLSEMAHNFGFAPGDIKKIVEPLSKT